MGIARIEVNEYTCELCGYKWVNRINGKDGPIPKRCAKCKHQHWEKGKITSYEKAYRNALKKRFGYFYYPGGMFHGGWRVEENIKKYLQTRPPLKELQLLLHPMSYRYHYTKSYSKAKVGCVPASDMKHVDLEATKKAQQYEQELSRQLLKQLMIERDIPYDENEAKEVELYRRHGKYATFAMRYIPKLCDALKRDQPGFSNEEIKARIVKKFSEELKYVVEGSMEELIQECWPDWIIKSNK
jgi:hypothetical protein